MSDSIYDRLPELKTLLEDLARVPAPPAVRVKSLKRELGDDFARDLLTAASLQVKARDKLGEGTWWVTEKSLQQATPWQVARVKSRWFSDQCVYDLCCGIGGDTLQLASRGPVVGVDIDARLVSMAAANLAECWTAAVVCADMLAYPMAAPSNIHIDPDRRSTGRRASRPEAYSPAWNEVLRLACDASGALVKLAPAANPQLGEWTEAHRVWISLAGSVREQSLLLGSVRESFLAAYSVETDAERSAAVIDRSGRVTVFAPDTADCVATTCRQPGEFMIDPDAAIRAAGLTDAFAIRYRLSTLGGPAGFLTGTPIKSPPTELAIAERVIWHGSSDDRGLRKQLRSRNCYPHRIKTRGVELDPARLQGRLRECGERQITLWIGRNGERQYAVMTSGDEENGKKSCVM